GKVKHLRQVTDVGGSAQVDTDQPEHRFFDHPQVRFDRWFRSCIPPVHAQIDRNVQHLGAFGEIHAKKENVAPAAMRQVHAHGGALSKDRVGAVAGVANQQFRAETQRLVGRMSHAKHPLVAAHAAHAAAHLVRESLKAKPIISAGQRARDGITGALLLLNGEKMFNRLLEPALQQVFVTLEGNQRACTVARRARSRAQLLGDMKAVNGIEEKKGADTFVKVLAPGTKVVQSRALLPQLVDGESRANTFERLVAKRGLSGLDDPDEVGHGTRDNYLSSRRANNSSNPVMTSSRSWPPRASASCAINNPYFTPISYRLPESSEARYRPRPASRAKAAVSATGRPPARATSSSSNSITVGIRTCIPKKHR